MEVDLKEITKWSDLEKTKYIFHYALDAHIEDRPSANDAGEIFESLKDPDGFIEKLKTYLSILSYWERAKMHASNFERDAQILIHNLETEESQRRTKRLADNLKHLYHLKDKLRGIDADALAHMTDELSTLPVPTPKEIAKQTVIIKNSLLDFKETFEQSKGFVLATEKFATKHGGLYCIPPSVQSLLSIIRSNYPAKMGVPQYTRPRKGKEGSPLAIIPTYQDIVCPPNTYDLRDYERRRENILEQIQSNTLFF